MMLTLPLLALVLALALALQPWRSLGAAGPPWPWLAWTPPRRCTTWIVAATAGALAVLVVEAPVGTATADLLLARFLTASGEAFLTGMLTAIFVAFRPEWLATYSDQLYLPKDRPGEH